MDSLCDLAVSTKKGDASKTGENGLGFKSIFKIADTITVHSGDYHLKFDASWGDGLGMIIPQWVDGPYECDSDLGDVLTGTLLDLHFKDQEDIGDISSFFRSFDFTFLLFTRNLEEVSISDRSEDRDFIVSGRLRHVDQKQHMSRISVRTNGKSVTWHFCTFESQVKDVPTNVWRPGQTSSIVRLAFPYSKSGKPLLLACNTFAFLPIRDYGFEVR